MTDGGAGDADASDAPASCVPAVTCAFVGGSCSTPRRGGTGAVQYGVGTASFIARAANDFASGRAVHGERPLVRRDHVRSYAHDRGGLRRLWTVDVFHDVHWRLDAERRAHAKLDCLPEVVVEVPTRDTNSILYVGLTSSSGASRVELDTMSAVGR